MLLVTKYRKKKETKNREINPLIMSVSDKFILIPYINLYNKNNGLYIQHIGDFGNPVTYITSPPHMQLKLASFIFLIILRTGNREF